jgi:hypothetical protein
MQQVSGQISSWRKGSIQEIGHRWPTLSIHLQDYIIEEQVIKHTLNFKTYTFPLPIHLVHFSKKV